MVTVPSIKKAFLSSLSIRLSLARLQIYFLGSPLGNSCVSMCVCTDTYVWIDVYTVRAETGFDFYRCIHLCFTCSMVLGNACKQWVLKNHAACQNQQRSGKRRVGVELLPQRAYFIKACRTGMGSLEDKERGKCRKGSKGETEWGIKEGVEGEEELEESQPREEEGLEGKKIWKVQAIKKEGLGAKRTWDEAVSVREVPLRAKTRWTRVTGCCHFCAQQGTLSLVISLKVNSWIHFH